MDNYLEYLLKRIEKPSLSFEDRKYARAEYNRALDFARRNGLTSR